MNPINRMAMVVEPKAPFWNWVESIERGASDLPCTPSDRTSVYLVEAPEGTPFEKVMSRWFRPIFDEQLNSWYRDPSLWPKHRTHAIFQEWFDVRVVDLVFDLGSTPLAADG